MQAGRCCMFAPAAMAPDGGGGRRLIPDLRSPTAGGAPGLGSHEWRARWASPLFIPGGRERRSRPP